MNQKRFGWRPSVPDQRDIRLALAPPVDFPAYIDLRSALPGVYDQGQLGSCTANALAAAFEFDEWKQRQALGFMPSRLFLYYNSRALEGTIESDSGASLRDGLKTLAAQGAPAETSWPYDISQFAARPPGNVYQEATIHKGLTYFSISRDLSSLRSCLVARFPFVFGFSVYESFMTDAVAANGQVPLPGLREKLEGGHAVLCVGYNQARRCFFCRNSWGSGWGVDGHFWLPNEYLLDSNLSADFWTLRTIE